MSDLLWGTPVHWSRLSKVSKPPPHVLSPLVEFTVYTGTCQETICDWERKDLPIFVRHKKHLSTAQIIEILLDPNLEHDQICKTQPKGIESNMAFIIDLKRLKHHKDVLCEELGAWKCKWLPSYVGCSEWVWFSWCVMKPYTCWFKQFALPAVTAVWNYAIGSGSCTLHASKSSLARCYAASWNSIWWCSDHVACHCENFQILRMCKIFPFSIHVCFHFQFQLFHKPLLK